MKKTIILIIAAVLCLMTLASCAKKGNDAETTTSGAIITDGSSESGKTAKPDVPDASVKIGEYDIGTDGKSVTIYLCDGTVYIVKDGSVAQTLEYNSIYDAATAASTFDLVDADGDGDMDFIIVTDTTPEGYIYDLYVQDYDGKFAKSDKTYPFAADETTSAQTTAAGGSVDVYTEIVYNILASDKQPRGITRTVCTDASFRDGDTVSGGTVYTMNSPELGVSFVASAQDGSYYFGKAYQELTKIGLDLNGRWSLTSSKFIDGDGDCVYESDSANG